MLHNTSQGSEQAFWHTLDAWMITFVECHPCNDGLVQSLSTMIKAISEISNIGFIMGYEFLKVKIAHWLGFFNEPKALFIRMALHPVQGNVRQEAVVCIAAPHITMHT